MVCGNVDHAVLIQSGGDNNVSFLFIFLNSVVRIFVWDLFLSVGGIISSVLFVGWYNCSCCSVSPVFMLCRSCIGKKRSAMFDVSRIVLYVFAA